MPTLPRVKNFDPISPGKLSCRRDRNETDRAADSDISGGIVLVECRLFGDAVVERADPLEEPEAALFRQTDHSLVSFLAGAKVVHALVSRHAPR